MRTLFIWRNMMAKAPLLDPTDPLLPQSYSNEVNTFCAATVTAPQQIRHQQLKFAVRVGPRAARCGSCKQRFRGQLSLKLSVVKNLFSTPILPVCFSEVQQPPGVCFRLWLTTIKWGNAGLLQMVTQIMPVYREKVYWDTSLSGFSSRKTNCFGEL